MKNLEAEVTTLKLVALSKELQAVEQREERLAAEERIALEEIASLQKLPQTPAASENEARAIARIEASRDLQPASDLARVQEQKRSLAQLKAQLNWDIAHYQRRLQELRAAANGHAAQVPNPQSPAR